MPLSWFKEHDNDFFMLFYNTLMSIREILPTLPSTKFTLSDHTLAKKIAKFEREAVSVYVHPVQDMARKLLTRTLVADGIITDQSMNAYFNLRESDFTKQGFSKLIAKVLRNSNAIHFKGNVGEDLISSCCNVLQGQMEGHANRLYNML